MSTHCLTRVLITERTVSLRVALSSHYDHRKVCADLAGASVDSQEGAKLFIPIKTCHIPVTLP